MLTIAGGIILAGVIIVVALVSTVSFAQEYKRWYQYERQVEKMSAEQFRVTSLLAEKGDVDSEMLLSAAYRHMPIRALALHAQRVGEMLVHPVTCVRRVPTACSWTLPSSCRWERPT